MTSQSLEPDLAWTVHPARQSPAAALLSAGVILALAAAAGALMGSVQWGVLSLVLLVLPLHRFFLPNRFVLDGAGATAGTLLRRRHIRWGDVRRFDLGTAGALLSSRFRPSTLSARSSVIILFRDNAAEVVARIESHLRKASSGVVATVEVQHAPPV
jgi:hypothetical protein